MNHLNVLYACDNNYAPFLGVSIFSLLENNKDIEKITIYAVLDNVSLENIERLNDLSKKYNRELIIVDAKELINKIESLGIPMYRGSYTTNFRLFFYTIIKDDVERLLYIDSDTIITGNLTSLLNLDIKEKVAGVVIESLSSKIKPLIGFSSADPYFNAGVMLIDVKNWKSQNCTQNLINHIKNVRAKYCSPDQDLLNICLKEKIKILPPEYNFTPFHRAYSDKVFEKVYGFKNYYSKEQIENARKNPIILHMYRFLGEFPWHKNNLHPDTPIFDEYLKKSPWKDYVKQESKNNSLLFKIERILYKILPKLLFLQIFAFLQEMSFKRQNKKLQKL